jgi:hypothetical protein
MQLGPKGLVDYDDGVENIVIPPFQHRLSLPIMAKSFLF